MTIISNVITHSYKDLPHIAAIRPRSGPSFWIFYFSTNFPIELLYPFTGVVRQSHYLLTAIISNEIKQPAYFQASNKYQLSFVINVPKHLQASILKTNSVIFPKVIF